MGIQSIIFLILRLITAGLLLYALKIHPYSFYIFLRWIVFITSSVTVYGFIKSDKHLYIKLTASIIFAGTAILFNPLFVVHLNQHSLWSFIDIAASILFIISVILLR